MKRPDHYDLPLVVNGTETTFGEVLPTVTVYDDGHVLLYDELPDFPGILVRYVVKIATRVPVIVSLVDATGNGIPSGAYRAISNAQLIGGALRALRELADPDFVASDQREYLVSLADAMEEASPTRGRPRTSDLELARLYRRYLELIDAGSKHPVPDLARERGRSTSTIRRLLGEARRPSRDIATPPPRGASGGALTPKAEALLREEDQP